jgi:hypothetical protein
MFLRSENLRSKTVLLLASNVLLFQYACSKLITLIQYFAQSFYKVSFYINIQSTSILSLRRNFSDIDTH